MFVQTGRIAVFGKAYCASDAAHCRRSESTILYVKRCTILYIQITHPSSRFRVFYGFESVAFVRSHDPRLFNPSEVKEETKDLASGANTPDLELISSPLAFKDHGRGMIPWGSFMSLSVALLRYGTEDGLI